MGSHRSNEKVAIPTDIKVTVKHYCKICTDAAILMVALFIILCIGHIGEQAYVFATSFTMPWIHEGSH